MRFFAAISICLLMTFVSCDTPKASGENPFLTEWNTPYGVPPFDRIRP